MINLSKNKNSIPKKPIKIPIDFNKVIFSSFDKKSGAVVSNANLLEANFINHQVKFEQGPLQEESSALLKKFFKDKRSKD